MSDRGMKKWMPFCSIIEQKDYLNKMKQDKNNVELPILSEDQQTEINDLLSNYSSEMVNVSYYKCGKILNKKGIITQINRIDKYIKINSSLIKLENIIFIKKL